MRIIVPAAVVGVTTCGLVAGTWAGKDSQIAYPAPAASIAVPAPIGQTEQRVSRSQDNLRPSLTPSQSAAAVKAARKAKEKAAGQKAADKKAPDKKTVEKKAAGKKAAEKKAAAPKPAPKVVYPTPALTVSGSKYATVGLNVRTEPSVKSPVVTVAAARSKLSITSSVHQGFRFISYDGKGRWVTDKYLSSTKPKAPKSTGSASTGGGVSGAPCASSAVENGLTPDAVRVHRGLCARFPQIKSYGGRRGSSDFHGTGQAVDAMIGTSVDGSGIADWVRANAKRLGVSEVIYAQKIWTVQRGSEGWRPMSNRGSATANHYDHVHVSVYGNRGTG